MLAQTGQPLLLLLANAHHEQLRFSLPAPKTVRQWRLLVDTAKGLIEPNVTPLRPAARVNLPDRTLMLFEGVRI
jgi:hypothetical protein